jgi:hypothetical protein
MTNFKAANPPAKEAPNHKNTDIAIDEHIERSGKLRVEPATVPKKHDKTGVYRRIRSALHLWSTPISIIGFFTIGVKSYHICHSSTDSYVFCSPLKRDCTHVRFPVPSRPHCF